MNAARINLSFFVFQADKIQRQKDKLEDRITGLELENKKLVSKIEILEREKKSGQNKFENLKIESEKNLAELRSEKDAIEDR